MAQVAGENAASAPDFDALMRANLERVFNERDSSRRSVALAALYHNDAVFYEADVAAVGLEEISSAVEAIQRMLPPDFCFRPAAGATGHHGMGKLLWEAGPIDAPAAATGTDIAQFEQGKITKVHVFLDPAPR
jgi:hypothetical protein